MYQFSHNQFKKVLEKNYENKNKIGWALSQWSGRAGTLTNTFLSFQKLEDILLAVPNIHKLEKLELKLRKTNRSKSLIVMPERYQVKQLSGCINSLNPNILYSIIALL